MLLAPGDKQPENNFDETILAFDFGRKRIGVAVGSRKLGLAHPLATVDAEKTANRFSIIEGLIREWQPVLLVVGLPVHADGTEHELTRLSRRFARQLQGRFGISTLLVALLSNGVRTMVPTHITTGTRVVVSTDDGSYTERAKD